MPPELVTAHESVAGPLRHLAAVQQQRRFRSEADIQAQAHTGRRVEIQEKFPIPDK